jgi:pimeloyl-ACP methyl ester carboxylesterase
MRPLINHFIDDFLSYKSSRIHYCCWGSGTKLLFAFHGYGESAATFGFLGEALGGEYTLVAIDLPFHGQTEWKEGLSFQPKELYGFLQEIAATFPGKAGDWGLIGYSMGGRIALQLFEDHPEVFDRLVLLAPDGLVVNLWYRLATGTLLGNAIFRWSMRRPGWLFLLLRVNNALRLVNPSVYKFAMHYIDDEPARQSLYTRWMTMRAFRPRLGVIAEDIRKRQVPVSLVYGKYDRIIRWERGEKFRKRGIGDTTRLILLDTGHQLLRPQFLDVLLSIFLTPP